jgi:hypothetical protein
MVKVKFLEALFAEQTKTHYLKGAEVEVPEDLAKRHGKEGTGLLEIINESEEQPIKAGKIKNK